MTTSELSNKLQKYAELVIASGVNLREGQELFIVASVEAIEFVRLLTRTAYERGARHVTVRLTDETLARLTYEHSPQDFFESFPEWQALLNNSMAREGAAALMITSDDPEALTGIDQAKLIAGSRSAHTACKEYYDACELGRMVWCIVGAASPKWAAHVFPGLPAEEAVDKLWEALFKTVRVDTPDPQAAWAAHRASFNARRAWLDEQHFDALRYENSLGTQLTVGLNPLGIWQGGGSALATGHEFFPNMPTEETFSTPDRLRAEGTVYASMPLIHHGSRVEDFWMRFEGGRVVDFDARVGREVLAAIFEVDEHANRLGEVALVPWTSPIRESGLLFYSTLYDENASCHLAVGLGFPDCLAGGTSLTWEELTAAGVNYSASHVDFMIGTADLAITGLHADGSEVPIFKAGEWAF